MNDTKVYRVLESFSQVQLNRFSKFIQSPYFNSNERITKLFFEIKSSFNGKLFNKKEHVWKKLDTNIPFSEQKWRKLLSDLLTLVEQFLIQENLSKKKLLLDNLLLEEIRDQKIESLFSKSMTNSSKSFERRAEESSEYYFQKYSLLKNFYEISALKTSKARKKQSDSAKEIIELSKTLDIFYAIEKLRLGKDLLTWRRMYKSEIDLKHFEHVLELIHKFEYDKVPAVNLYYLIFKVLSDSENKSDFVELQGLVDENFDQFSFEVRREFFIAGISYFVGKINKGEKEFIPIGLKFYSLAIDNEVLLVNGELSPSFFRGVIGMAVRNGYLEYAEEFVNTKSKLLNIKSRENAIHFSWANIYFYKKDFNKVIEHINLLDFDDVWYNINSKAMLIATYYEIQENIALESLLTSYNAFIRREKSLVESRRKGYLNFIKIVRKLDKLYNPNKQKLNSIKEEILTTNPIVSKAWCIEKIDELIANSGKR